MSGTCKALVSISCSTTNQPTNQGTGKSCWVPGVPGNRKDLCTDTVSASQRAGLGAPSPGSFYRKKIQSIRNILFLDQLEKTKRVVI